MDYQEKILRMYGAADLVHNENEPREFPDYEDEDWEEGNIECDGCDGEGCPLCCINNGTYAPGTEECEFCEYSDECAGRS